MSDSTRRVDNSSEDAKRAYRADLNRETRPMGTPKSNKDFGKVLSRPRDDSHDDDDDVDEVDDSTSNSEDASDATLTADRGVSEGKRPMSLFDLSGAKNVNTPKPFSAPTTKYGKAAQAAPTPSTPLSEAEPTSLIPNENENVDIAMNKIVKSNEDEEGDNKGSSTVTAHEGKSKALDPNSDPLGAISGKNRQGERGGGGSMESDMGSSAGSSNNKDKDKIATRFATDQPDLSYINSMTAARQDITVANVKADQVRPTTNIQEIINQMVDAVQEMKSKGQSDTIITLKQPPLFAGTTLVVTSFDSAKGEFNISFQGLSQTAKNLLDMGANQTSLKLALEERGYAVHIITTTTEIENVIATNETNPKSNSSRDNQDQEQQQGKKKKG